MNSRSDIDRALQAWMSDGPAVIPDRVVDVVAARIGVQPQRPAWPFPWRITVTPLKLMAGLAAALVVAVVGFSLLPRQSSNVGESTPPSPLPATAAPTAGATPGLAPDGPLSGGRYLLRPSGLPLTIEATGPTGWFAPAEYGLGGPSGSEAPAGILIAFISAEGIYEDPCHWDLDGTGDHVQPGDVNVGPTVDDMVAAIRANASYTSTTPTPVTIDGYAGQELEIQLPDESFTNCDRSPGDAAGTAYVFSNSEAGIYAQGPANRWHLSILDVDGNRLIAAVLSFEGTPQAELDLARNVIETLEITP